MKRNLWSSWSEYLGVNENDPSEEYPEKLVPQPRCESDVMKLPYKDSKIFGYCSEYEDFYLVVCEVCGMRLKPQSLCSHMELRHQSVYQSKLAHFKSIRENANGTPSCSKESSNNEKELPKIKSETCSVSKAKDDTLISNNKHAVYVHNYPESSYVNSSVNTKVNNLTSYNPPSGEVAALTKSVNSGTQESLTNAFASNACFSESSLPSCDSQTSMTVFLHHSFLMPNMKLCDISDQCTNPLPCLTSKTLPTNNYLPNSAVVTQVFPEKMIESPTQYSQIHNLSKEVSYDWNNQQSDISFGYNGAQYTEWHQPMAHFRPVPQCVPPMTHSEQMSPRSFNYSELKMFDDLESQVLIHNATVGT